MIKAFYVFKYCQFSYLFALNMLVVNKFRCQRFKKAFCLDIVLTVANHTNILNMYSV